MRLALKDHITKKLMVISGNSTVAEGLQMMRNNWIRHLPVIDENNEFVIGIVSERDLLASTNTHTKISSIMSTPIRIFDVGTGLDSVVRAMIEEKVSAYLITDNDEVIGIVTTEDMLVLLENFLSEKESAKPRTLLDFLMSPVVQKTVRMVSDAGI